MSELKKIDDEVLEQVTGGKKVTVRNDATTYANIRLQPGLDTEVLYRADNGTVLETTGNTISRDGYIWYEIFVPDARAGYGWIAGSLIGY